MLRLIIEPKRLRKPQEGGQSREKQIYKIKVDIKISRCSAGGSAPALGKNVSAAGGRKSERF